MGLLRSLSPGEIVSQLFIARFVRGRPVRNVVFMGMGEPFHNFEAVARSLDILTDSHGFNLKRTRVTVSTCGLVDPLVVFLQNHARKALLALSLNAARDALRDRLMPVNRAHGLARLKQTLLRHHPTDRPLFVEYVLIDRVNDTARDVRELAAFCSGLPVRVNLIPLNATARGTTFRPSPPRRVDSFYKRLCETGLHVIKRKSRGEEIRAACGQLGSGSDLHREGERTDAPDQGEGIRAAVKTSVRRSPPRSNSTSFSSPTRNTGPESKK
jgi:23S rRNA (adenine2503-C2)-methyltransferase